MSEIRVAEIWEDGLRTDPKKKSFEWWYFDANFSDGSTGCHNFFYQISIHPGWADQTTSASCYQYTNRRKTQFWQMLRTQR